MRKTYRILAYTIAVLVVVQAGAIAWAFFGVNDWITNDGGVINKAYLESEGGEMQFTAEWGFAIHMFYNGTLLIPLVTLATLVVSFFAKVPGGIKYAVTLVVLVILQIIVLPGLSHSVGSGFGALHGINAMVLLGVAIMAGRRASVPTSTATGESAAPVAV